MGLMYDTWIHEKIFTTYKYIFHAFLKKKKIYMFFSCMSVFLLCVYLWEREKERLEIITMGKLQLTYGLNEI